ncbi:uncharacterized protein LOC132927334 [Rhopalosiphum padi]|uniref:uncharacterized protein LOC132927334 n=1 Tax=Rhopalosiphum padi TaxID=40932 RepID=UPI00298DC7A7|nr:uncharacterized protein LOC132927334 [Rhopalosiphum padi]
MHLIFFKGSCKTIVEAGSIKNGIVTLAYLFDVTENQHQGIDHITTHLSNVQTFGKTSRIPVFPLSHLIHNQPVEYFTYSGQIDIRGCKCGVTQWIVFTKTSDVNREQMDQFRCMLNKQGHAINSNYRKANPVPAGNNTRPYLVVLNGYHSDSTDGVVVTAAVESEAAVPVVESEAGVELEAVVESEALVESEAVVESEVLVESEAVAESEAGVEVAMVRSRSGELRQISRRPSLTVVASVDGGNSRRPLCVKSTKTQLLRRSFNLNKLSVHNYWPPTTKPVVISNHGLFEHVQRATVVKTEKNNLQPSLSLVNATRPSWK